MQRSQYLAQALEAMGGTGAPATMQGPDLGAMKAQMDDRKAWEAANPGQSYAMHGLSQMRQNLAAAPGRLAAVPGQVMSNLGLRGS